MQDNALIARPAHQPGWRLNGQPDLKGSQQEENLENQNAFHSQPVLGWKQHTTRDKLNAKENIDSPGLACHIEWQRRTTRTDPLQVRNKSDHKKP